MGTKADVEYVIRKKDGKVLGEYLSLDSRVQPRQYKQHNILMQIQVPNEHYFKVIEYINHHGNIMFISKNKDYCTIYYLGCPNQLTKSSLINWFGTTKNIHATTIISLANREKRLMGLE